MLSNVNNPDLLNLIPKNSNQLRPMEKNANYLICIIMNIDKKLEKYIHSYHILTDFSHKPIVFAC